MPPTLDQPYYFLSGSQVEKIRTRLPTLRPYIDVLPAWIPHRRVAEALNFSGQGIERALEYTSGRPYVWATEFENVHSFWRFEETEIEVKGSSYASIEAYYHAQKPSPFDKEKWDAIRCDVMKQGLQAKFKKPELSSLLVSTNSHPLASIKPDRFWGIDPWFGGRNMLGVLLEEIRGNRVA